MSVFMLSVCKEVFSSLPATLVMERAIFGKIKTYGLTRKTAAMPSIVLRSLLKQKQPVILMSPHLLVQLCD